jgi:hypothetical protein
MSGSDWLRQQLATTRKEVESWSQGKREEMQREAAAPQVASASKLTEPPRSVK